MTHEDQHLDPLTRRVRLLTIPVAVAAMLPMGLAEDLPIHFALCLVVLVAGAIFHVLRRRPLISPDMNSVLVLLAFAWLVISCVALSRPPVLDLAHFLMNVSVIKLCSRKRCRDYAQLIIMSAILMIVDAIVSGSILFPIVLTIFLLLTPYALILLHQDRERQAAHRHRIVVPESLPSTLDPGPTPATRLIGIRPALLCGAASLVVGIIVFLVFPRVGAGMLVRQDRSAISSITGFSTGVRFGDMGRIAQSDRMVMRIELDPDPNRVGGPTPPLLFRSMVLDTYDYADQPGSRGWRWRVSGTRHGITTRVRSDGSWSSLLTALPNEPPLETITQNIWLEPLESPRLFALYPAIAMKAAEPMIVKRWVEDFTLLRGGTQQLKPFKYSVKSVVDTGPAFTQLMRRERESFDVDPPNHAADLAQRLPGADRILALVDKWTDDLAPASDPRNQLRIAERLCARLRVPPFSYSLDRGIVDPSREPIEDFLFNRKRGHCEYFASALAVMCQLKGIPARLVQGFQCSEYNSVGHYYVVRERDAHAWVEVYDANRDWVPLDPTPAAPRTGSEQSPWLGGMQRYVDYLQFHWATGVVGFDSEQRTELISAFRGWLQSTSDRDRGVAGRWAQLIRDFTLGPAGLSAPQRLLYWVILLFVLVLIAAAIRLVCLSIAQSSAWLAGRVQQVRTRRRQPIARLYERFVDVLAGKGVSKDVYTTPREFVATVVRRDERLAPAEGLVDALYAAEFGAKDVSPDQLESFRRFVQRIEVEWKPTTVRT